MAEELKEYQTDPIAAYARFKEEISKKKVSHISSVGRRLGMEKRSITIASFIISGRMDLSDLPKDEAVLAVLSLWQIHIEIRSYSGEPGKILDQKKRRPRVAKYGGGDFFAGGCETPVNKVTGICMKQR